MGRLLILVTILVLSGCGGRVAINSHVWAEGADKCETNGGLAEVSLYVNGSEAPYRAEAICGNRARFDLKL
jgi:hypothetical protein